jgi:hypothetical protein
MVRGTRLAEKQRAMIMKQKPRPGRRFGQKNRRKLTLDDLRRTLFTLMERGHTAEAACRAVRKKYGAEFTPEAVRRWRIQMYRQSLTGN